MKFIWSVILVAILSAVAEWFFPWWSIAIVCFAVAFMSRQAGGRAFGMGFLGIGLLWLAVALVHDIPNQHILSTRMAALFKLPHYGLFLLVTVLIGGLIGGISAWSGALIGRRS
jgi:hypothetical protein